MIVEFFIQAARKIFEASSDFYARYIDVLLSLCSLEHDLTFYQLLKIDFIIDSLPVQQQEKLMELRTLIIRLPQKRDENIEEYLKIIQQTNYPASLVHNFDLAIIDQFLKPIADIIYANPSIESLAQKILSKFTDLNHQFKIKVPSIPVTTSFSMRC